MAKSTIKNVKIVGVSCAVPNDRVRVEDLIDILGERKVKKFIRDTGVEQIFYSKNRKTIASDLCFAAAQNLFQQKEIDRKEVDAVVFITQTPDYVPGPATANILQYRLGLSRDVLAWDVNLGCSAYPYGIFMASKLMGDGISTVLLLVGDEGAVQHSGLTSLNALLFGGAGTATLLKFDTSAPVMQFEAKTYGEDFSALGALIGNRLAFVGNPEVDYESAKMDGLKVFSFSVEETPAVINSFLQSVDKSIDDYEALLLHQSNKSIMEMIAKKVGMPIEKTPFSIDVYGNTSSATIPNCIAHAYGNDQRGEMLPFLMVGYGVGMSISILDCKFSPKDVLPIVHTDEAFEKGWEKVLNAQSSK